MASIKDLGGGKYRVFVCNGFKPDGRVNRSTKVITAKSLADAKKQANALEVDFKRGQQIQFCSAPTFAQLAEKWRELKKPDIGLKSQEQYESYLNRFLLPRFGHMKLRDIKAIDIETYLRSLDKMVITKETKDGTVALRTGYSEKTKQKHYMFIQRLFNLAVKWDMVEYNPCIKVDTPTVHKKDANYYEEDNIEKMLECLEKECQDTISSFDCSRKFKKMDEYESNKRKHLWMFNDLMHKTYIWVALSSACRRGELAGLTVDDVDFNRNIITIKQTGHYDSEVGLYTVPRLKNGCPSKIVDMPQTVMDQMKKYLESREELFDLMGWGKSPFVFISLEDGKVTTAGGQIMPDVISKWFERFIERNNLPKITLHQVRHTSISYLINQGVDIKMVADRAGHQNTRTTEEVYGHIYGKNKRATAERYDDLFKDK